MRWIFVIGLEILGIVASGMAAQPAALQEASPALDLSDPEIVAAYERAASQNVLAAVNSKVFDGYWSVCADGGGFGYGNTYPSLDGHQMTDALLRLGQVDVVKANWDYVRMFQRPNGQLPLAILPAAAGLMIGSPSAQSQVDANGGFYRHWVPGDPLRALAGPTYIQNADVIFRYTQDRNWLIQQLPSLNLAADYLASLLDQRSHGSGGHGTGVVSGVLGTHADGRRKGTGGVHPQGVPDWSRTRILLARAIHGKRPARRGKVL